METSKQKNMVILKNLPSNLIEEAYIIVKSVKKAKKLQQIENSEENKKKTEDRKKEGYIIKEAEMLVSDYISKIENKDKKVIVNIKANKDYKRLKKYAYISSLIIFLQILLLIIK